MACLVSTTLGTLDGEAGPKPRLLPAVSLTTPKIDNVEAGVLSDPAYGISAAPLAEDSARGGLCASAELSRTQISRRDLGMVHLTGGMMVGADPAEAAVFAAQGYAGAGGGVLWSPRSPVAERTHPRGAVVQVSSMAVDQSERKGAVWGDGT